MLFRSGAQFPREAYYGGRVELFSTGGRGRIAYTDINSLYPWTMTQAFPNDYYEFTDEARIEHRRTGHLPGWGVADVEIDVPMMPVPPLPMRRDDGSVYYPVGRLAGKWTTHEINNAVNMGARVVKVGETWGSLSAVCFYRDFVDRFYELRRVEADPARKQMLKLVLNNLYGQLGMSGMITRSCLIKAEDFDDAGNYGGAGVAYGRMALREQQMPLPEHVNYLHAAYVTSYARLRLLWFLRQVEPGNLIYCDTDSIIFWRGNELPFPISDRLGEMKLEGEADRAFTHAPKMYEFGDEAKAKGVRKDLARQFIETGRAEYDLPYKLRESIRFYEARFDASGRQTFGKNSRPVSVWRRVVKERQGSYDRKKLKGTRYIPRFHDEAK